jgi:hypothetical protein
MKNNLIKKVLVIAIPTYAVAIYTEAMVYTVPMLAITTLVATSIFEDTKNLESRIDEDGEGDDSDDNDTNTFGEYGE